MTSNRGAALVYPIPFGFPLFVGKGRPTTPLSPFLFSSDPRNRGTHTASVVFEAQDTHSWYREHRYTTRKRCIY